MSADDRKREYQDRYDHDLLVEAVVDIKSIKEDVEKVCVCVFGEPDAEDTGLKGKVERLNVKVYYAFAAIAIVGSILITLFIKSLGG